MTTLLLTEVFPPQTGGSGRWFWEIYSRLPRDQYVIAAGEHPQQAEFDSHHNLRVVRLPLRLRSWGLLGWQAFRDQWRVFRQVRGIVKNQRIGMLHCGKCLPEGLTALLLQKWCGLPYLCFVHGEELNLALGSRELTFWMRRVMRGASVLIANSNNTSDILRNDWQVAEDRIRILHPGVDTKRFVPASRNPATRVRWGWGGRPVVLTVGRLQKRKGHDQMILALRRIKEAIPDVLYAIVGDGEEREFLSDLTAREHLEPHVQFLGELGDEGLVECYQQCELFALPNRQVGKDIEGFGMVLLEAQACGRPVLAGASGGTAETMKIPETGRLVCCDTPDQLAEAVIELLSDRSRLDQMGAAGRRWVVDGFDWTSLAAKADQVFRRERTPLTSDCLASATPLCETLP